MERDSLLGASGELRATQRSAVGGCDGDSRALGTPLTRIVTATW
jgi:hypothetical protein